MLICSVARLENTGALTKEMNGILKPGAESSPSDAQVQGREKAAFPKDSF